MDGNFKIEKRTKIYIVDSDEQWIRALSMLFEENGECTVVGSNGDIFDKDFNIEHTQPHILLVNVDSIPLSKLNILRHIKLNMSELVILCYSEQTDEEIIIRSIEMGSCGFLVGIKSDFKKLNKAIKNIHEGIPPISGITSKILVSYFNIKKESPLTPTEFDVIMEMKKGKNAQEIANHFKVSKNTIRTHITHIYDKLNVHDKASAIEKLSNI